MATNNPLTQDDKSVLETAKAALKDAKEQLARAKLAGLDMSDEEREVNRLEAQVDAILKAYFPTR